VKASKELPKTESESRRKFLETAGKAAVAAPAVATLLAAAAKPRSAHAAYGGMTQIDPP